MKEFILNQITAQYYQDLKTTRDLKICLDSLQLGTFDRDDVQRILKSMPSTVVRDLSLLYNSGAWGKDVDFLAKFKDLHAQLKASMELKLKGMFGKTS